VTATTTPDGAAARPTAAAPLALSIDVLAAMLNVELPDHPVYDAAEVQWFDDDVHGTGMLAFLSRREDRRVDYYVAPGLRLDRSGYAIGGGTGSWTETAFAAARLHVAHDGVDADVRFTDREGRAIEIRVDDRDGRPRRRAALLAPVSAGIDRPRSLLVVWMPAFDLVHVGGAPPTIRIDGRDVAIGRLPGARLHRRHLVKTAAPVVTVEVNPPVDVPAPDGVSASIARPDPAAAPATAELVAACPGHRARLRLVPPLPAPAQLGDGTCEAGRWAVEVDGTVVTGGTWRASRAGSRVDLAMDVDRPWRPGRLPPLMRVVTRVLPVFRRWPTTYRWRAEVRLDGEVGTSARWERTTLERGTRYRRLTRP
jgi:hypothetical protein